MKIATITTIPEDSGVLSIYYMIPGQTCATETCVGTKMLSSLVLLNRMGRYRIRNQEVTFRGEWRMNYLEGWEGSGSCPVFFNVRIFTYRVTLHIYCTRVPSLSCDSDTLVVSK